MDQSECKYCMHCTKNLHQYENVFYRLSDLLNCDVEGILNQTVYVNYALRSCGYYIRKVGEPKAEWVHQYYKIDYVMDTFELSKIPLSEHISPGSIKRINLDCIVRMTKKQSDLFIFKRELIEV